MTSKDEMPDELFAAMRDGKPTWWKGGVASDDAPLYRRADLSPPVPDDVAEASKILGNLVAVWQSLPAGNYSPDRIQSFMYDLKSIVDEARTVIRSDNKSSIPNAIVEAVKWAKSVKELSDIRISGEEFYADDHAKSKHLAALIRASSTPSAEVRALREAIENALSEIEYDYTNAKMVATELKKALIRAASTPPVPVDTIAVPRDVYRANKAMMAALLQIKKRGIFGSTSYKIAVKCLASLDAVLSEGE